VTLPGSTDFHAAAAQIIPVLLLTMSFEHKIFQRKPDSYLEGDPGRRQDPAFWNPFQIVGVLALLGFMVLSEVAALIGLYAGGSPLLDALVWLGLGLGVLGVVQPLAGHQWRLLRTHLASASAFDNQNRDRDGERQRARSRGGVGLIVFFVVALLVVVVPVVSFLAQLLAQSGT